MNSCPFCASTLQVADIGGKDRLACTGSTCEFVHWDNPKPVTATLIPMDGGIVLVKRKFPPFVGDWCLPGGFMENSEEPEESAAREVFEETGLEVQIDKLLSAHSPGRGINVLILFYLAKPANGLMVPGDDAEDVGAFKYSELPRNICFDLHRKMVAQFFKQEVLF